MHSRFDEFRRQPLGRQLEHLIDTPARYLEYAALSRASVPAITAIVHELQDRFPEVNEDLTARQFCGALVADIMRRRGHTLVQPRGRVPGGYFTFGTVWSPRPVPVAFEERLVALGRMPEALEQNITPLKPGLTGVRPQGTGFSALEHACHLRDLDRVFHERLEAILTYEAPVLPSVDGTALAVERRYHAQDLEEALNQFRMNRQELVAAFARLSEDERRRYGLFDGIARVTVDQLIQEIDQHDRTHLLELDELRESLTQD